MLIQAARRAEAAAREMLDAADGGAVTVAELREALAVSRSIAAAVAAFQASAAHAVAGRERHGDGGAEVLAETTGASRRDAVSAVKTAETLRAAPSLRAAVESGRVAVANARHLASAVGKAGADAVASDGDLLAKAETLRPEQFGREARRWVTERDGDDGQREHDRQRARRTVRIWNADDGMMHLRGEFDTVSGTRLANRLRAEAGVLHRADKKQAGQRRSFDQCMADALCGLASGDGGGRRQAPRAASVDSPTPDAAASADGDSERADADNGRKRAGAGMGPAFADICVTAAVDEATGDIIAALPDGSKLPRAVFEELCCGAKLTGVVFDRSGSAIWRSRPARRATEGQRQVLLARYGGCFACGAHPALCEIHHIKPVSQGGRTEFKNLVPVCWRCHQKIHRQRWWIQTRPGGNHTLHPPDSGHRYGPAHGPEALALFR